MTTGFATSPDFVGPIMGVVDGSNAAPGEVGEFITAIGTMNYAAFPVDTTGNIPLLNVPPGDWDFTVSAAFTTLIGGAIFEIPHPPVGLSNAMFGYITTVGDVPGLDIGVVIIGQAARGSFAVNTQLTFFCQVFMSGDSALTTAGQMQMRIEGRRRR